MSEILNVESAAAVAGAARGSDADRDFETWWACNCYSVRDLIAGDVIGSSGRLRKACLMVWSASREHPKCEACDGKGWYATGPTENAIQLQCQFCYGQASARCNRTVGVSNPARKTHELPTETQWPGSLHPLVGASGS